MKIIRATHLYEKFLASHVELVPADLVVKHRAMARSAFSFLRGTFYRWAPRFVAECPELASALTVLGVGDLHLENFGTWRDAEGRLVWGINDFDEACELPWTNDLVRLGTSARFAIEVGQLHLPHEAALDAILSGYVRGLEEGGRAFVLDTEHRWLNELAHHQARDPERFWKRLEAMRSLDRDQVPGGVRARLEAAMPERGLPCRFGHRVAGIGSLGRPRFVALAEWHGARVARETKPLVPSAWRFAPVRAGSSERRLADDDIHYKKIVAGAVRSPDPWLSVAKGWVLRRLSPTCTRIELSALADVHDEERLLRAMGFETANVHLGTRGVRKAIRRDLAWREPRWLHLACARMVDAVQEDYRAWLEHVEPDGGPKTASAD